MGSQRDRIDDLLDDEIVGISESMKSPERDKLQIKEGIYMGNAVLNLRSGPIFVTIGMSKARLVIDAEKEIREFVTKYAGKEKVK
jgi:hypothetical protein